MRVYYNKNECVCLVFKVIQVNFFRRSSDGSGPLTDSHSKISWMGDAGCR